MTPNWEGSRFPVVALSRVAEIQLGKMLQPSPATTKDELTPYLRAGNLSRPDPNEYPEMFASSLDRRRYEVLEGDLLVVEGGDVGRAEFARAVPPNTIIQNSLHRLRSKSADARFIKYALDAVYASGWLEVYCSKSTFGHLTREKLASLMIPAPSLADQRAIVDYLDGEAARITAILSRRRHQVTLLEQRRHTLLGDAMSGRLVESSAIAEAEPRPLRLYVEVDLGRARAPENATGPYMVQYLRAANVKDGFLELDSVTEMNFTPREQAKYALRSGDVLVTEGAGSLAAVGANAVWSDDLDGVVCFQNHVLRLRARDRCHPRFLAWWARFAYETGLLATLATGAQILNLGAENVRALRVRMPSYFQQAGIADFLDSSVGSIEASLAVIERQVALLLERRRALITAAVSGRLEIPGVAA